MRRSKPHVARSTQHKKWLWPLAVAASGALCLLVGVSTVREGLSQWKVDQEIGHMQAEVEKLEGKKLALSELIQRLDSPEALDKEARTRLDLRQPGERVIILRGMGDPGSWNDDIGDQPAPTVPVEDTRPNSQRWIDYFFPKPTN
ncbi:MAG: septum formation initiator family protein [Candidatus Uhrbacteria bacterium]